MVNNAQGATNIYLLTMIMSDKYHRPLPDAAHNADGVTNYTF